MKDLWPEDLLNSNIKAPVSILEEQASFLGRRTKNLVEAEIKLPSQRWEFYNFQFYFYIIAPTLANYRYKLFSIAYDLSMYPVHIFLEDEEIKKEVKKELGEKYVSAKTEGAFEEEYVSAKTEEEFIKILEIIFNSNRTKEIIRAIMAHFDIQDRKEYRRAS